MYTLSPFIFQKKTFDSQVMYFAQSNIRVDINWYICMQVTWRKTIHLHLVIEQTLLSKATYNWEYIKRLILKRQTDRGSANNTKSQALFK